MQDTRDTVPPFIISDRECLEAWRRAPDAENLRPLVGRYGAFVYSSALRRSGSAGRAAEVTRAVFLVLARRARKLRRKTVLAGWLFRVTAIACRKLGVKAKVPRWWQWAGVRRKRPVADERPLWVRVAPEIDAAVDRLSSA